MNALLTRWFSGSRVDYHFVLGLLGPVVADQFFLVSFNFLNTAMISGSGEAAISAVNMVSTVNVFLAQVFVAMGLGGTVLIAQYYGNKELKALGQVVNGTLYGALIAGVVITVVFSFLRDPILTLLFGAATKPVMANAQLYLMGVLASYPCAAVVNGINGALRGIGRTKDSLQVSVFMNGIYLLLNVLFIYGMHLGVLGMVVALNISRVLGAALALWLLHLHQEAFHLQKHTLRRINWAMVKRVLWVAMPFAAESVFFSGGKIVVQMMIVSLGTKVIVTYAIAGSWTGLSEIIPSALQTALVPIVGQSMGRGNVEDAHKLTKSFVKLGVLAFIVVDGLMCLTYSQGIKLFNPDPALIPDIFTIYLIFAAMHVLVWSFSFILPSALRASGDGQYTTVVSLITMWAFRVALGYVFGIMLGYGLPAIAVVMTLEWALRGALFTWRFHSGKWQKKKLI